MKLDKNLIFPRMKTGSGSLVFNLRLPKRCSPVTLLPAESATPQTDSVSEKHC